MAFEKLGARWFVVLTSPVEIYFYFRTFSLHDLLEPGDDLLLRSPVLHQVETVNPITFVTMQYFFVNKKPIRYTPLGIANKNSDFIQAKCKLLGLWVVDSNQRSQVLEANALPADLKVDCGKDLRVPEQPCVMNHFIGHKNNLNNSKV